MCAKTGYNQRQLAQHLKITPQYLSKTLKDNRFVREDRLPEMAAFFGVPLSEFIKAGE